MLYPSPVGRRTRERTPLLSDRMVAVGRGGIEFCIPDPLLDGQRGMDTKFYPKSFNDGQRGRDRTFYPKSCHYGQQGWDEYKIICQVLQLRPVGKG